VNRIIWGADGYYEIRIRHTSSAPDRFLEEITPALQRYSEGSAKTITLAIQDARENRLADVDEFLANRFGGRFVKAIKTVHELEELRPIKTRWDALVGATAYARSFQHQDARVTLERQAGSLLNN
jgi:hypothetical protein